MGFSVILAYAFGLVLLYLIGMLLVIPIKIIGKLIINGILGGIILFVVNLVGGIFGLSIVINPLNALIVGFLGIPGIILLLILQVIL
ncbi:pro-sigmaK processing inhibitor BofA family protein [Anaerosalibacter massiliensis]|uniref:Pro-sigmaK processing inhibitor BofA family protein n=1 Tax=Anaerosalibacter massiliensis TaxID=1347392 RepID=A0A9X2MJF4_9FIRM|nr:pro-sigmaK processing inhibitor BofA family protein [Anaerosalibacter massiliensis]MCR2044262.1 pro-sigmaK processing inhibitor BofA family protein [Anaerosalibacter massiliensis]